MSIRGTYQDGQVVLNQPTDWPNGLRVDVMPSLQTDPDEMVGMTEEEQSKDQAAIASWIQNFRSIPALSWPEEEIAKLEKWRAAMKAFNVDAVTQQWNDAANAPST